jgi:hypothetical protein
MAKRALILTECRNKDEEVLPLQETVIHSKYLKEFEIGLYSKHAEDARSRSRFTVLKL